MSLRCWYCGIELVPCPPRGKLPNMATIDHLTPLSRGGSGHVLNLVDACWLCNANKKTKTLEEYRVWLFEKTPEGEARRALMDALMAWRNMPLHQQQVLTVVIEFIDRNFPMPRFWGECRG